MNLIDTFQDLVAQVPELIQPLIVAAAGAIPFVEGEGAVAIGIIGGLHPIIAVAAAVIGNFVCVAVLVLLSSRTRSAVITHHRNRTAARESVPASATPESAMRATPESATPESATPATPRAAKFQRAFERYGVPGVSLLGPLLLPTQFTATMLAAAGIGKVRILIWQAVAILGWTTLVAIVITSAVSAVR